MLTHLASWPVIKVLLRFRTAFWEDLDHHRYRDGAFFQDPTAALPTCWTHTLAEPLAATLFFAGEAADTHGEAGTVAGALHSGRRAAREVLDAAQG
jgi:hypothetical protein